MFFLKSSSFKEAVAAAYTFFQANADEEAMATLDYYDDKEGVTPDMYVDLESASYITIFEEATHAYKIEDYPEAIRLFNNALDEYYDEIGDCRALCEMPVDLGLIFMSDQEF